MKKTMLTILGLGLALQASADGTGRADSHAPIGVMGDHTHKQGEWMVSYRHMAMSMSGNLQGGDSIRDADIVATPNRFAPPPVLRIVPQEMESSMDMLGMMYAPSDRVTLMLMLNYLRKDMRLTTYEGMMGTTVRGHFETQTEGLGDTSVGALISLMHRPEHRLHLNAVVSVPTGALDEEGQVLPPMSMGSDMDMGSDMGMDSDMGMGEMPSAPMMMTMRLPYSMQLGSGTWDVQPGLTYSGNSAHWSWGAQYLAVVRLGENDEGYTLGDKQTLTGWGQYLFHPAVSASLRIEARSQGAIDGMDDQIQGPVQTANPDYYGGDWVDAALGVNLLGQHGGLAGHRLAFEYSLPVLQDVNGIQMEMDAMWTLGYQYAF